MAATDPLNNVEFNNVIVEEVLRTSFIIDRYHNMEQQSHMSSPDAKNDLEMFSDEVK